MNDGDTGEKRVAGMRRSCAWATVICLAIVLGLVGAGFLMLRRMQGLARCASCQNDVVVLCYALRQYAVDHDGLVPPISRTRGNLMMDAEGFYPEYLENTCWVQCEYSPTRRRPGTSKNTDLGPSAFNDDSFCYLPWEIRTEEEGLAFIEAYKTLDLSKRDEDLVVEIDGERRVLPRTRITPEAFRGGGEPDPFEMPVFVEWPDHAHRYATVAFVNGISQSKFIGDEFPTSERFWAGLREIASMDKPIPEWERW